MPPLSGAARDAIEAGVVLRDVVDAYHRGVRWPDPEGRRGLHVRMLGTTSLVVDDAGIVVMAMQRYQKTRRLAWRESGQPRGRGGAGRLMPTSFSEIVARVEALGADVKTTRKHYRVSVPGRPGVVFLPRGSSDCRAWANATRDLAKIGLDVKRPARRKGSTGAAGHNHSR